MDEPSPDDVLCISAPEHIAGELHPPMASKQNGLPFWSSFSKGLSMPIKLWIDGKVRELLRSAGGDGGG